LGKGKPWGRGNLRFEKKGKTKEGGKEIKGDGGRERRKGTLYGQKRRPVLEDLIPRFPRVKKERRRKE